MLTALNIKNWKKEIKMEKEMFLEIRKELPIGYHNICPLAFECFGTWDKEFLESRCIDEYKSCANYLTTKPLSKEEYEFGDIEIEAVVIGKRRVWGFKGCVA